MKTTLKAEQSPGFWPKYKPWIIGGAIVLVLVLGAAIVRASGKEDEEDQSSYQDTTASGSNSGGGPGASSGSGSGFKCLSREYPLQYGTCHPDVKHLQRYLAGKGADLGSSGIDGKFGRKTQAAAKSILGRDVFTRADAQNVVAQLTKLRAK